MPFIAGPYPPLRDLLDVVHVVAVPLRTRFRGVTVREAVLLDGPAGWGEFAPFVEYPPDEAARWLAAAVEAGWGVGGGWPAPVRDRVAVNAIVPAVDPVPAARVVAESGGCTTAKVKVAEPGQTLDDDVARLAAVRAALGPTGRVRVDANGAWTLEQAERALARLTADGPLEYVEQPCATLAETAELRRRTDVPVAVDEGLRKAADPTDTSPAHLDALRAAADVVVVKVAPLGGVRAALRIATAVGLPAVVSSALDTSVGLSAGVALAAALPDLPFACGLGSGRLLAVDVVRDRLLPADGALAVARPEPVPALLAELAAAPERVAWWRSRLADAYAIMAAP